jgi:DivIVA domain-containing protein
MALTPEDVVNKRFQPTKFREGYDQDEVDDFLDEVVVELRRLNQENEELRSRLGGVEQGGSSAAQATAADRVEQAPAVAAPEAVEPTPEPAPVATPVPAASTAGYDEETTSTASLLQLARRLHDEHVREGVEKRDALIAEGQTAAARLISEAEEEQRSKLDALEQEHRSTLDAFEQERQGIEERIDGLRVFEREYRQKLKNYIEGQLRDLDSGAVSGDAEPAGTGASGFSGFAGN